MELAFHSPSRYNISGRLEIEAKLLVWRRLGLFCFGVNRSGFPQHAGGEGKPEALKNYPRPGGGKNDPGLRDKPGRKEGKNELGKENSACWSQDDLPFLWAGL